MGKVILELMHDLEKFKYELLRTAPTIEKIFIAFFILGVACVFFLTIKFVISVRKKLKYQEERYQEEKKLLKDKDPIPTKKFKLGEFIEIKRNRFGYSQKILGNLCGTSGEYISLIENDEIDNSFPAVLIIRIGEKLRLTDKEKITLYELYMKKESLRKDKVNGKLEGE